MAWEQRRGNSYYYRKKREGGRVRSEYIGSGIAAQMYAENVVGARRQQATERANAKLTRHSEAVIDRQLADVEVALFNIIKAALHNAGFHQHKGQWRKKRHD